MSGTPPAPNPTPPNREDSQVRPGSSSTGSEKSPGGGSKPRNLGDVLREFAGHQQTMRAELAKVIVGQEDTIGPLLARGGAGAREDVDGEHPREHFGRVVQTGSVYPGFDAFRHHRDASFGRRRRGAAGLPVRRGTGVDQR